MDIDKIAAWGPPRAVNTKDGPRILRVAPPSNTFSTLWKTHKQACRDAGLGWGKDANGAWQICWWQADKVRSESEENSIAASKATDSALKIPAPLGCEFLGFQKAGIAFALEREGTLIGDEMGLGKTLQAIGVINADPSIRSVLVICPASLKINWQREASKWLSRPFRIGRVDGSVWPENCDFIICNFDVAAKHHRRLHERTWDLAIVDEAQYVKNPKAQRSVAILGSAKKDLAPITAKRRIALTGTPILNRPIEAQPILGFLDPDNFGHFWRYAKKYCAAYQGPYGWDLTGASNLEELQRKLRATCMIRRLKRDVLTELPPKRRQVIELPANGLLGLVKRESDAHAKHRETLAALQEALEMAKLLEDQEAYADAVQSLHKGQGAMFEEMAEIRHMIALEKVPYVIEHVLETDQPIVVFAWHRDVVEKLREGLSKEGRKCVSVIGGMSDQAKDDAVQAFQSGRADVFIGNIKAAGVGLTLTRSSHVVFCELDWVPANMTQAEDRTHRIGQTASVLIQHLVLEGSLDQVMAKALVSKQDIADQALDKALVKIEAQEPVSTVAIDEKHWHAAKAKAPELSASEIALLLRKLQYLDSVCDGARSLDSHGFNKFDSRFGKFLAAQATLTPNQAIAAERLCVKYRKQLEGKF